MKKVLIIIVAIVTSVLVLNSTNGLSKLTFVEPIISKDSLLNLGMPKRIANQYILIRKSVNFVGKSFFIVDTKENLIFLFDKNGKFITKSPTIDGMNKQNLKYEYGALSSWSEHVNEIGFKWDGLKRKYIDTTGKNRIYSHKLVFNYLGKTSYKFFPKGIYNITKKYHDNGFIGKGDNTYNCTFNGKDISLAIHGLYKSEHRIKRMNYLIYLMGNDFEKIKVPNTYTKEILNNINNSTYNNSFGCINVPEKFLEKSEKYAVNSLVFVMGEETNDYLIK